MMQSLVYLVLYVKKSRREYSIIVTGSTSNLLLVQYNQSYTIEQNLHRKLFALKKSRVHNFSAGPGALPLSVLMQAKQELVELPNSGMSVLEISHRSIMFEDIIETTQNNIRTLLEIPNKYHILFLSGGASLQFSMVPINFLHESDQSAYYLVGGTWGKKAREQALKEGDARVLWDGSSEQFSRMPASDELEIVSSGAYVHITSNETIQGIQLHWEPTFGAVPLICDMSSDFLSRPVSIGNYGLIYAGVQKNVGPAGVTIVIIREDLLERIPDGLHSMLDYGVHVEKDSAYNTPPVFSIYMANLVTKWLLRDVGGLVEMAAINHEKSDTLYRTIDESSGFYIGHAQEDSRSVMNVTWRLEDQTLEQQFVKEAYECGLHNLKGHRFVGGLRASIYNAVTLESVNALNNFMLDFQARWG